MRKITYITSTFVALMALQVQTVNADNINKVQVNHLTCPADAMTLVSKRPKEAERLFRSEAVEKEIQSIVRKLTNKRIASQIHSIPPFTMVKKLMEHLTHSSILATSLPCGYATLVHRYGLTYSWLVKTRS